MRILCKIFGCEPDRNPCCKRCGEDLYEWDFIQIAWLEPWYRFVWWLQSNRDWFFHRCDVCKKRMFFSRDSCCSQKCYDRWSPF